MRKIRSEIKKPLRPWDKERIEEEKKILKKFGLRRKKEVWKAESILRNYRRRARIIEAKNDKKGEKILLDRLHRMGIIEVRDVALGAVLDLKTENILKRRLQTVVAEKGLANTPLQARQLITHGHIAIEDKKTIFPSYLVPRELENKISYYGKFSSDKIEATKQEKEVPQKKPSEPAKEESPEEAKNSETPEKGE